LFLFVFVLFVCISFVAAVGFLVCSIVCLVCVVPSSFLSFAFVAAVGFGRGWGRFGLFGFRFSFSFVAAVGFGQGWGGFGFWFGLVFW